ncbi:MAG: amidohydrolase [Planctomycetota bacterium]
MTTAPASPAAPAIPADMSAAQTDLRAAIAADAGRLAALRRDIHAHPELGFAEHRTAGLIAKELADLGIEHKTGMARGTGVLGYLPAATPTATTIALRADIDALPIEERTGKPYASTNPGVMHACGHDGHTTILLGAARALASLSDRPHNVLFVFQPAEEGGGGGEKLCDEGALAGAAGGGLGEPATMIYGLHGWPRMQLGHAGSRPGPLLASTDEFDITVSGVGGHAAMPHLARDPIVAASAVVLALQTIAARSISPVDAGVCTVGQFNAGTADNIIPESARLSGTVRALTDETRALLEARVREIAASVSTAHGCTAAVDWHTGYPVTRNHEAATDRFFGIARRTIGEASTELVPEPSMGGEDFSYYGRHIPACFFLLGTLPAGADPDRVPLLHQPEFDFNDDAIPVGVELMCAMATANA